LKGIFVEKVAYYEVLILAAPEITNDEERNLEKQFTALLTEKKASVLSFERWGKYKLYYPVNKNEYGVYFLSRFQSKPNQELLQEIRSLFVIRFDSLVMRHMISVLEDMVSLEYQRPRSLEEAPAQEGFLKDRFDDRKDFVSTDSAEVDFDDVVAIEQL